MGCYGTVTPACKCTWRERPNAAQPTTHAPNESLKAALGSLHTGHAPFTKSMATLDLTKMAIQGDGLSDSAAAGQGMQIRRQQRR